MGNKSNMSVKGYYELHSVQQALGMAVTNLEGLCELYSVGNAAVGEYSEGSSVTRYVHRLAYIKV